MNKVISYLSGFAYAESLPESGEIKLFLDVGGAQAEALVLDLGQIEALKKFLRDIEEDSCKSH